MIEGNHFLNTLLCRNGTLDFTIAKFYADLVFLALILLTLELLKVKSRGKSLW
jgi:hypothetical protein